MYVFAEECLVKQNIFSIFAVVFHYKDQYARQEASCTVGAKVLNHAENTCSSIIRAEYGKGGDNGELLFTEKRYPTLCFLTL